MLSPWWTEKRQSWELCGHFFVVWMTFGSCLCSEMIMESGALVRVHHGCRSLPVVHERWSAHVQQERTQAWQMPAGLAARPRSSRLDTWVRGYTARWPGAHPKGKENAEEKRPILRLTASAQVSFWGLKSCSKSVNEITKLQVKQEEEKEVNQLVCLQELTLTLCPYSLKSSREQVWRLTSSIMCFKLEYIRNRKEAYWVVVVFSC